MSESPPQSSVLLTLDDVYRLRDERDAVAQEHAALSRRLDELNGKLTAIATFVPPHIKVLLGATPSQAGGERSETPSRRKWAPSVYHVLMQEGHGLTVSEIKDKLAGNPLVESVGKHNSALYNALSKMVGKGDLIKDGSYYCLPGQSRPENASDESSQSLKMEAIREALKASLVSLRSADILKNILDSGHPASKGMGKSAGAFYKALSSMTQSGEVIREGRQYRLSAQKNEPHDGGTSHGSDASSVGARPGVFG